SNCPLCQLAETPVAHELYRDEAYFIVLDRESLGFGHCLVIPKRHVAKLYDLDADEFAKFSALTHRFARELEAKLDVKAVGMVAFGSGLQHAHLHLVPHDDATVLLRPSEFAKILSSD